MQFPEKRKGRNPDKQKKEEENLINRREKRGPPRTYNVKKKIKEVTSPHALH